MQRLDKHTNRIKTLERVKEESEKLNCKNKKENNAVEIRRKEMAQQGKKKVFLKNTEEVKEGQNQS